MSDATTQTVNAAVVDTDNTASVDAQPAPNQAEVEAKPTATSANLLMSSDPTAFIKDIASMSEADAIKKIDEIRIKDSLRIISLLDHVAGRDALQAKLPEAVYKHLVRTVCRKLTALGSELNDADRWQKDILDNTGLYVQWSPMGSIGVEIGAHHHTSKDDKNVVTRAGAGVYLRHTTYETLAVSEDRRKELSNELAAALA